MLADLASMLASTQRPGTLCIQLRIIMHIIRKPPRKQCQTRVSLYFVHVLIFVFVLFSFSSVLCHVATPVAS